MKAKINISARVVMMAGLFTVVANRDDSIVAQSKQLDKAAAKAIKKGWNISEVYI